MSEYQFYEFQAIDRPLSDADRQALRGLSTRARITATSFTNEYHWGGLKGDPVRWMERSRTAAELHTRAAEIRKQAKAAAEARREAERRAGLGVVRRREAAVWREVRTEIEKRSARGYDRALALLLDLRALAQEDGTLAAFSDRVRSLRVRHSRKPRFIERLQQVDLQ